MICDGGNVYRGSPRWADIGIKFHQLSSQPCTCDINVKTYFLKRHKAALTSEFLAIIITDRDSYNGRLAVATHSRSIWISV